MIRIYVRATIRCSVDVDVESFEDISDENMKLEDSNDLIEEAICDQYGMLVDQILNVY